MLGPGCSVISAAVAEGETQDYTGSDLRLALAVGYEDSCRFSAVLGVGTYSGDFMIRALLDCTGLQQQSEN